MITIEEVVNGFIVCRHCEDGTEVRVVEDHEEESTNSEAVAGLCNLLVGWLEDSSRYSDKRCRIVIEPGDKYEVGDDNA